ncbi:MAG: hypothetical protein U9N59_14425 [Campylobacterota bacterium]|nr:hypothetical protein [Campylobacterota bacterium]
MAFDELQDIKDNDDFLKNKKTPQSTKESSKNDNNIVADNAIDDSTNNEEVNKIDFNLPKELEECKNLLNWLNISDNKTHPITSLVSLFTIASAITARGYYTKTRASTTLYLILIGKTGLGKNTIYKTPNDILDKVYQDEKIITSKITSEGAMDDLFRVRNIVIQVIDEFGDVLNHMLNDKGGWLQAVAAKMKTLYSLTNGIYKSGVYSSGGGKQKKAKPFSLKNPCYGVTGITTKQQLLTSLDASKLHDGFLNRFIILDSYGIEPVFHAKPEYDIPIEILNHIESIPISQIINDDYMKMMKENGDFEYNSTFNNQLEYFENDYYKTIKLSEDADDFYDNFIGDVDIKNTDIYRYCINDTDETKRAISVRWRENTIRLATALVSYEKKDVISLEVLRWCYNLVKNSSIHFLNMFNNESIASKYLLLKQRAITWFKNNPERVPLTHLSINVSIFKPLKAKDRNELLSDLEEIGILTSEKIKGKNNKPTTYYKFKNI